MKADAGLLLENL